MFESIDNVLVNELHAKKEISFSAHDKCWKIGYRANKKLICEIYFEKDSVVIVIKFSLAKNNIKNMKICMIHYHHMQKYVLIVILGVMSDLLNIVF